MKKQAFFVLLLTLAMSMTAGAQDITGSWYGTLQVQGMKLRLVFHLYKTDTTGYMALMDSPDQGARGIPMTSVSYRDSTLVLKKSSPGIVYNAKLNRENVFVGTFSQSGLNLPLNLSREKTLVRRPQEPRPPFPYHTEDVKFENVRDGITLAGTLTVPEGAGPYPAVVLISGSGPQNRDEEVFGHKPFLVIADYLTRHGLAVLRFDDRGTGASTGNYALATTADFTTDVLSAIAYLHARKEIDPQKTGLIGHSEGALIAPLAATMTDDVYFIVLMAAPGLRGDKLLLLQQKAIGNAMGMSDEALDESEKINKELFEIVVRSQDTTSLNDSLIMAIKNALKSMPANARPADENYAELQARQLTSPWMVHFLKYDPAPTLQKVRCHVLALYGEKDLQVPPEPNMTAVKDALAKGGNQHVTVKVLPGLNHLFQECRTGLPGEYATIEQTISPAALKAINDWIQEQVK